MCVRLDALVAIISNDSSYIKMQTYVQNIFTEYFGQIWGVLFDKFMLQLFCSMLYMANIQGQIQYK